MELHVALASGRSAAVQCSPEWSVGELKAAAEKALGRGFLRLWAGGRALPINSTVLAEGLEEGCLVTAVVQAPHIVQPSGRGFAALLGNGRVVCWGTMASFMRRQMDEPVRESLTDVRSIASNLSAFAAIRKDGSVAPWRRWDRDVQDLVATLGAFAARTGRGSVVIWGSWDYGGPCEAQEQVDVATGKVIPFNGDVLKDVQLIRASGGAFAALLTDGSVSTWGNPTFGADCSAVQAQLKQVQHLTSSHRAFAALLASGGVVTWGDPRFGGDCRAVQDGGAEKACQCFLPSLGWAMVLLGIFMSMGALILATLLQDFLLNQTYPLEEWIWIWNRYGTAYKALYTLYEITFAGNWPVNVRPVLESVSQYYVIFFILYITIIVFAVIRVISAIFLKDTLDAANNDAEQAVVERLQSKKKYVDKLEAIFKAIDTTGDGMITEERLAEMLANPVVQTYFQTLDVDVHESAALFHLMDNGDGEVTLEEFIHGIMRCKGHARALDQVAMQNQIKAPDIGVNRPLVR
ncbi:Ankyrin repeat domain-containing protein 17 [Durusdinium trenchii]|uniref:Ankyrin repeat domain-containing protein 17 n=1 Tax=Durusdinium trenchii TaxID=1381693 RepID=A0ABP0IHC3_9DINO